MLELSQDGPTAEKQMRAVIFYLTTFGYIDGDFDAAEKEFVRDYIAKLVDHRVRGAVGGDEQLRAELGGKYTAHFHEVFETIDAEVRSLFTESVADGENQKQFVHSKLKLRCFEIFKSFDESGQNQLLDTIDELIQADGQVHPAELEFRGELAQLLEEDLGVELVDDGGERGAVTVTGGTLLEPAEEDHPFFRQFEVHYSSQPERLVQQVGADRALLDKTMSLLEAQRARGAGKLTGKRSVSELEGQEPFLDGHVYVHPLQAGRSYDVTVLGDLHGCYSCLKGAILQTSFFAKVALYKNDPARQPYPILVLLGDYIDRGIFSYNGVLRAVMQTFVAAPEHVYVLRGNHEYYFEHQGRVYGGVKPAEAINTLKPHLPAEVFQHYMRFFDSMANMLLLDRTLFVHAGIPRDLLLKERYKDLSSLNDPDLRFQMMWSDPSEADVIPAKLQEQSARFAFGRLQCLAFLKRLGCHTLVRGHEKVDAGFKRTYDDGQQLLVTVFSAGGKDNSDLPPESGYRSVSPMALTIKMKAGESTITPFLIDYHRYNDPAKNAFFQARPEIEHRAD
ncbi:MAG: serine/threonine protein phosphatase [Polyangiaceae bacterium]|nr:serine/threonine protein phosphatase [Polyangiaceae bacterium]